MKQQKTSRAEHCRALQCIAEQSSEERQVKSGSEVRVNIYVLSITRGFFGSLSV